MTTPWEGPFSVSQLTTQIRSGFWGANEPEGAQDVSVLVVRNGDLHRSGALTGAASRYFSPSEVDRARVEHDDILFTGNGEIGKVHLVQNPPSNLCVSNFVRKITVNKERVDPRWLYYCFQLPHVPELVDRHAGGSTIKNLRKSFFDEPWLHLPSLEEQTALLDGLEAGLTRADAADQYLKTAHRRVAALRTSLLTTYLHGGGDGDGEGSRVGVS